MTNSAKTPSGKAKKGQITVRTDSGSIKACFPRNYFNDGKQLKLSTGIAEIKGWEATASKLERRLQLELEEGKLDDGQGNFNIARYQEILEEYGLRARLRLVKQVASNSDSGQLPPKPQLSILEVWDMYCEFKKHELAITTYEANYSMDYRRYLSTAINAVGEDSLKIRDWLIVNRDPHNAKKLLRLLAKAYAVVIRQGLYSKANPFDGLTEGLEGKKRVKEINPDENIEDHEVENKNLAFTWKEAESIMQFLKNSSNPRYSHWYYFVSFKFLTGCRQGEAIALWWNDVNWEKEYILIRRSYSSRLRKFKPTKNETIRFFPMPKDGRLWNLLKEIPQGEANECVFKNREDNVIHHCSFGDVWKGKQAVRNKKTYDYPGICQLLINEAKISKYLPPYNTRHTFITHQIYDLGREPDVVNAWCEHSEQTSKKHYRDNERYAMMINPESDMTKQPANDKSEVDLLREQNKMLMEQLEQMRVIMEQLTKDRM
jgi:integrase